MNPEPNAHQVLGPNYMVGPLISQTDASRVYEVRESVAGTLQVAKIFRDGHQDEWQNETQVYEQAANANFRPRFPTMRVSSSGLRPFLILSSAGPGWTILNRMQDSPGGVLSMDQAIRFGIQAGYAVTNLHRCKFVHRDICPENFLLHFEEANPYIGQDHTFLMLCNFGKANYFMYQPDPNRPDELEHVPENSQNDDPPYINLLFGSPQSHRQGKRIGRRDDLISTFYCMAYLRRGELPWSHMINDNYFTAEAKSQIILALKELSSETLFQEFPSAVQDASRMVENTQFCSRPDYQTLFNYFALAQNQLGQEALERAIAELERMLEDRSDDSDETSAGL